MTEDELRQLLINRLQSLEIPSCGVQLGELGEIESAQLQGDQLRLEIALGAPLAGIQEDLAASVWRAIADVEGVGKADIDLRWRVREAPVVDAERSLPGVRNIVAVASGKGGVGKSTTAVNLALALAAEGASVGILDADIYGPSVPAMLGVSGRRPDLLDDKYMLPMPAHGLHAISMGMLATDKTPMVWRGPMASGALQQLLRQTAWPELDYLIIDMPPGTGDIQLTLAQTVPVSGAVIVTTPQDIALLDAQKGIEMFRKVDVPVIGVVENMALHVCSQCGHEEHIFGSGGGQRIASDYQTQLLGSLPLDLSIREQADGGTPSVAADADSAVSRIYRQIARQLAISLHRINSAASMPTIEISDD